MKKIFGIVLFVAACAFTSQAQDKTEQRREKSKAKKEWKKSGREELNLNAEQRKEMKSINMEFKNQAKVIRDDKSLTQEQQKQQVKSLHAKRQEKVKAILTPEQKQKMAQHKRPRKKQHNRETTIK
jgi:Spy/CpxP family protein refolding chaperone